MDGSCIDEISTTTHSTSTTPPPSATSPASKPLPEKLFRLGSGTSVIMDANFGVMEAESTRKLPSSRYKGVVPQPNGRWGGQIYEKHQRVWLGTFNEEKQAAVAYDTAVQRFRGRDAVTNFKPLSGNDTVEVAFLSSCSKAEIVDMLRKHTYNDELDQSRRTHNATADNRRKIFSGGGGTAVDNREQLFEKTVTPSDVGKLNRLVIPKQHAEKHFPLRSDAISKGVLLNFEDVGGKVWRFRYSYWNSSQSYVLTKGWSRFVKEKGLRAGDMVSFKRSNCGPDKQMYIEWKLKGSSNDLVNGVISSGIRLFGVDIYEGEAIKNNDNGSGRRMREMEVLGFKCSKKQKMIDVL